MNCSQINQRFVIGVVGKVSASQEMSEVLHSPD